MASNDIGDQIVAVRETITDADDIYDKLNELPEKLLELSAAAYKDKSKRRLSLPISGSRKSSITSTDGNPTEKDGGKTKRRDSIRRESNVSCSSWTEDSYTDYESDDDIEGVSPRGRNQKASNGFGDFCVRNIQMWKFGRHEIEFAENEMEGLIKLRDKVDKVTKHFFIFE